MKLSSRLKKTLSFCLAIFPACFLAILILIYSVNVPYWDQWGVAPLFVKLHNRSFSFSDLLIQHNESRLFFPKFVFITLAYLTHWNVRYEMVFTFSLACIIALNIYYLGKLTVAGNLVKRLFIATITNLLIFAPIQWENWLWGIQMIVFIPILCITTCLSVAYSSLATKTKFLISIILSTISTFSYANGILCWIVVFPVLILQSRKEVIKNRWLVFSWIASFVLNIITYFYDYKKPPHHPSFLEGLTHPQQAIHYFLSFLGSPISFGTGINTLTVAPIIGLILILLFIASCLYLLKYSLDSVLLYRMAAWLTIGFYTIVSALITTLGRVGFGVQQALDSRYTTFSIYLAVSVVYLVVITVDDLKNKHLFSKNKQLITKVGFFLTATFLSLQLLTSIYAVQKMSETQVTRLQAKSCLLFLRFVQEECLTKRVYPDMVHLKYTANDLDTIDLIQPSLIKSSTVQDNKKDYNLTSESYGSFDTVKKMSADEYVASGWAVLPQRREPSDVVILSYENIKGEPKVFTVVDMREERNDIAKKLKDNSYSNSGWEKAFSSNGFPKGYIKIEAWAFDSNTGETFKINGSHVIQTNSQDSIFVPGVKNIKEVKFKSDPKNSFGFLDQLNSSIIPKIKVPKANKITANGWAILPNEGRLPDSVIITYGDSNSLIAVAPVNLERLDVVKVLENQAYKNSGWSATFNSSRLPTGQATIKAWAYNSSIKEATQLNNTYEIVVSK